MDLTEMFPAAPPFQMSLTRYEEECTHARAHTSSNSVELDTCFPRSQELCFIAGPYSYRERLSVDFVTENQMCGQRWCDEWFSQHMNMQLSLKRHGSFQMTPSRL